MIIVVPITLEQIVEETRHWPPEKVGELVGRLTEDLHAGGPETEAAWKTEIDRRIEEIQTGTVTPMANDLVDGVPLFGTRFSKTILRVCPKTS